VSKPDKRSNLFMRQRLSVILVLAMLSVMLLFAGTGIAVAADTTYRVQSGDTLSDIAIKYGVTVSALAQTNGIKNVNIIYVGQVLTIPGTGGQGGAPAPTPTPTPQSQTPSTETLAYIVVPGDSLTRVAAKFGITIPELAAANNLSVVSYLYVGQTLKIPGKQAAPAPATTKPATQAAQVPVTTVVPVTTQAPAAKNAVSSGKWIDVNLKTQRLTAYEGSNAVFSSLVSTGLAWYPTPTGTFQVYLKYQAQLMTGGSGRDYYYLPNVPYVMYFYQSYAIHGTYWHNNFGRQMSHGCVNLPTPSAQWVFNWAPMGTPVNIHY
jgi:LysM repeat protein